MVFITVHYQGELHCEATHEPSGTSLQTDAPKDNHGKGERFSPTDLLATALATCMLTVMGIAAKHAKLDIQGATARVGKHMTQTPVRRIGRLEVVISVPLILNDAQKKILSEAALQCPVHQSLHPDIETSVVFQWA